MVQLPGAGQFALAHEICELNLLSCFPEEAPQRRHRAAMFGASELLMPAEWFNPIARRTQGNLRALKAAFSTASHEAVAYRLLRSLRAVATVFDHGCLKRRVGTPGVRFPPSVLLAGEGRVVEQVTRTQADVHVCETGVALSGYWIAEPGWPRVILITQPDELA